LKEGQCREATGEARELVPVQIDLTERGKRGQCFRILNTVLREIQIVKIGKGQGRQVDDLISG